MQVTVPTALAFKNGYKMTVESSQQDLVASASPHHQHPLINSGFNLRQAGEDIMRKHMRSHSVAAPDVNQLKMLQQLSAF